MSTGGITAPSGYVEFWAAPIIGLIGGFIVVAGVLMFERLRLDDPVGMFTLRKLASLAVQFLVELGRPRELGEAIGAFARWAVEQDAEPLEQGYDLDRLAAQNLLAFLREQQDATRVIPSDRTIVAQKIASQDEAHAPVEEIGEELNQGAIVSTPAVGDLTGDGKPEIVVGTNEEYAADADGGLNAANVNTTTVSATARASGCGNPGSPASPRTMSSSPTRDRIATPFQRASPWYATS